jgi:hypothetical protein
MFCGLKGDTARPRFLNALHNPAEISDFPTSDPVPWSMTAAHRPRFFILIPASPVSRAVVRDTL